MARFLQEHPTASVSEVVDSLLCFGTPGIVSGRDFAAYSESAVVAFGDPSAGFPVLSLSDPECQVDTSQWYVVATTLVGRGVTYTHTKTRLTCCRSLSL